MQFVLFTDNLADLTIEQACRGAKEAGFEGIDLTLRAGGHVDPQNAEVGLAEAVRIANEMDISIPMATTAITDVGAANVEDVIASCAHHGIREVKLGYWPYRPFGDAVKQLDIVRGKLSRLITLTRRYGVKPSIHVHSGPLLACGGANLYLILKDFDPQDVGAYLDPLHMTVEGGLSGWEIGLDLLTPWVSLVGVKNFRWLEKERDQRGQLRFDWQYVPLADGQAPLPQFFDRLKQIGYDGVVSLHSEYKGGNSFKRLTTTELLLQSAQDLQFVKSLFERQ